jgi:hypothetical protein
MSTEARDLRDLARQIEELCHVHPASSMARDAASALVDYLCLRAHVIELDRKLELEKFKHMLTSCEPAPASLP